MGVARVRGPGLMRTHAADPRRWRSSPFVAWVVLVALFVVLHRVLEWQALDAPLLGLNVITADAALAWLAAADVPLLREGTLVMHAQGFVAEVHQTCTLLLPAALLAAAIAMHAHGTCRQKLWGMLLGTAVVALLNQARLVGVFWVGVKAPEWFDAVHSGWAPAALMGLIAAYGSAWAGTVRPRGPP